MGWICVAPGPNREFDISKFFCESQGQIAPGRCPYHLEKDKSVSSAAVVGGSLWSRMKAGALSGLSLRGLSSYQAADKAVVNGNTGGNN